MQELKRSHAKAKTQISAPAIKREPSIRLTFQVKGSFSAHIAARRILGPYEPASAFMFFLCIICMCWAATEGYAPCKSHTQRFGASICVHLCLYPSVAQENKTSPRSASFDSLDPQKDAPSGNEVNCFYHKPVTQDHDCDRTDSQIGAERECPVSSEQQ